MKKILSFILALLILSSIAVLPAFAEDSVEDLGHTVIYGALKYEVIGENEIAIIECVSRSESKVIIPTHIEGSRITEIRDSAFEGYSALKEVIIEAGIEKIGNRTFALCKSLKSVNLPDTLTHIGEEAFLGCTSLKYISLPDSLYHIGDRAFGYNLKELNPDTFTYEYNVDPGFGIYSNENSVGAEYAENNSLLVNTHDEYPVPEFEDLIFELPSEWVNIPYKNVYCNIIEMGTEPKYLTPWQGKKAQCYLTQDRKYAIYDLNNAGGLEKGTVYIVYFSIDVGFQTHEAPLTTDCVHDTLYTNHTYVHTTQYSRPALQAKWKNTDVSALENLLNIYSGTTLITTSPDEIPSDTTNNQFPAEKSYFYAKMYGDVNFDDDVNIKDATLVQQYLAGFPGFHNKNLAQADFFRNGQVTIRNATEIQKFCAGIACNENIGKNAYTQVTLTLPDKAENQKVQIVCWDMDLCDFRDAKYTWATHSDEKNSNTVTFTIPAYMPNFIVRINDSFSHKLTLEGITGNTGSVYNLSATITNTDGKDRLQISLTY